MFLELTWKVRIYDEGIILSKITENTLAWQKFINLNKIINCSTCKMKISSWSFLILDFFPRLKFTKLGQNLQLIGIFCSPKITPVTVGRNCVLICILLDSLKLCLYLFDIRMLTDCKNNCFHLFPLLCALMQVAWPDAAAERMWRDGFRPSPCLLAALILLLYELLKETSMPEIPLDKKGNTCVLCLLL